MAKCNSIFKKCLLEKQVRDEVNLFFIVACIYSEKDVRISVNNSFRYLRQ